MQPATALLKIVQKVQECDASKAAIPNWPGTQQFNGFKGVDIVFMS